MAVTTFHDFPLASRARMGRRGSRETRARMGGRRG